MWQNNPPIRLMYTGGPNHQNFKRSTRYVIGQLIATGWGTSEDREAELLQWNSGRWAFQVKRNALLKVTVRIKIQGSGNTTTAPDFVYVYLNNDQNLDNTTSGGVALTKWGGPVVNGTQSILNFQQEHDGTAIIRVRANDWVAINCDMRSGREMFYTQIDYLEIEELYKNY